MGNPRITYRGFAHGGYDTVLHTRGDRRLRLTRSDANDIAHVDAKESAAPLSGNRSLVALLTEYAETERTRRRKRNRDERAGLKSRAEVLQKRCLDLAELCLSPRGARRSGYCSACFLRTEHTKLRRPATPAIHLCGECGAPTTPCVAPGCDNFALRSRGPARMPRFCGEHRHDIYSFSRALHTLPRLESFQDWATFDKRNLAKGARISLVSVGLAAVAIPSAIAAAPAIGGALGASALGGGLSGAAATSHGLALLGGGAVSTGGLGMSGGVGVIAATGAALGGATGATASAAYLRSDDSFRFELLEPGTGTAVVLVLGFLTEAEDGWGGFRNSIEARYPGQPVYRLHWGATELKAFGTMSGLGAGKAAAVAFVARLAKRATKRGARRVPWFGRVLAARDVATNPWSVAQSRADATAAVLADALARTRGEFVLVGHSLGGRIALLTAQTLGTRADASKVAEVHALGAAVTRGELKLIELQEASSGGVWNYHSHRDLVLKLVFRTVRLGRHAVGFTGIASTLPRIRDVDVSTSVAGHSGYGGVRFR